MTGRQDRHRAFEFFMDTGSVGAYLLYAAICHREEGDAAAQKGERHAGDSCGRHRDPVHKLPGE